MRRLRAPLTLHAMDDRIVPTTVTVYIYDFDFSINQSPGPIVNPTIQVGDTIRWEWQNGFHSTVSVAGIPEMWDSGNFTPPHQFEHTFTHAGSFEYYCDLHGFDQGNQTADGMSGVITVQAAAAATITDVTLNAGAAQRSQVTQAAVTFNSPVTLPANPADAFQLKRSTDNAPVALAAAVDNTGPGTKVNLTFTAGAVDANSLADGRYTLTALAGQINAGQFDGNGDGTPGDNYVLVGDPAVAPKLYRLFGDSDGDNDVDTTDFGAFRAVFGGASSIFDFDNDGDVDTSDFGAFRGRFGASV